MPLVHARLVTIALRVAAIALLIPLAVVVSELSHGTWRVWLRFVSLVVVGAALVLAQRRQHVFGRRLDERDKLDRALTESEAKFSGILSIAADAIISVDESQRIIHFNHGAEEIFGYAAGAAVGQPLDILIPARFRAAHPGHMRAFAQSGTTARRMGERREIFGLRADGTEFPAEASISKLDLSGHTVFTVVLRDVTDRKRSEENERFLAETASELSLTLDPDTARQAIADLPIPRLADACLVDVVEPDGKVRRVVSGWQRAELTPALAAIGAVPIDEDAPAAVIDVMRRGVSSLVTPVDEAWIEAHEEPASATHWRVLGAHSLLILPFVTAKETIGALTLFAIDPARTWTDETTRVAEKFAATATRALENARLYATAQRANRARDEVLGVVSHDLRNPLSAITMSASALRDNEPMNREELLGTISESAAWMNRLIQDLLDVANIDRGQLSLHRAPVAPESIVEQSIHMFSMEAVEHHLDLTANVAPSLPAVHADAARVVQVLGNLLRNAIKFTPDGGTITVSAARQDNMVVLSVRDTGRGIAPEAQARVFDRYWHSRDGARTRGSGLGLSIAKGIVEAHGGRIWVESTPGQGSTFAFSLPVSG